MYRKIRNYFLDNKNAAGFTLLEMLVVFTVIGLLTGVGFASFVSYSKKQTLDQAVQDLKTGIDQAKFNAVSRVKPTVSPCSDTAPLDRYRIRVCTSTVSCTTSSDLYETDAGCIVAGASSWTTSLLASKKRPSTITATILPGECGVGSNNYMQFYALSGLDAPCRIVVTDGSVSKTLCVDGGGNTSILPGDTQCSQAYLGSSPTPTTAPIPTAIPTPTSAPSSDPVVLATSLRSQITASGVSVAGQLNTYLNSAITYLGFNTQTWKNAACQQLTSFNSAVTSASNSGSVPGATAADWISQANGIRSAIPCVPPN